MLKASPPILSQPSLRTSAEGDGEMVKPDKTIYWGTGIAKGLTMVELVAVEFVAEASVAGSAPAAGSSLAINFFS